MRKKLLIATGDGDCPGLNAIVRSITKAALLDGDWEVLGSKETFRGIMVEPPEIILLTGAEVAGIHVRGGSILRTSGKSDILEYPVMQPDGTVKLVDRSQDLADRIRDLEFEAAIIIGGEQSQKIAKVLSDKGVNVVGVYATIENQVPTLDVSFGFSTAIQVATDNFDKLITSARDNRSVAILEVKGLNAGWIALHTAIAGRADICLVPEIPYDIDMITANINKGAAGGKSYYSIVVAEGAYPESLELDSLGKKGRLFAKGGIGSFLETQLEEHGIKFEVRTTVLGQILEGSTPVSFDRILASAMGTKAFELVTEKKFGQITAFLKDEIMSMPISEATKRFKTISPDDFLVKVAKSVGVSFGD